MILRKMFSHVKIDVTVCRNEVSCKREIYVCKERYNAVCKECSCVETERFS